MIEVLATQADDILFWIFRWVKRLRAHMSVVQEASWRQTRDNIMCMGDTEQRYIAIEK